MGSVLQLNERLINRRLPPGDGPMDPYGLPWVDRVQQGWPEIRREVDALIKDGVGLPEVSDVAGFEQGNEGSWTTFMLCSYGDWLEFNCRRCPDTVDVVRDIPGLQIAGFSVLRAGTHLPRHRGPNKGALRYQLGVRIPDPPGSCRIQVGEETFVWDERKSLLFDHTIHHEAWNDSTEDRFVLFIELLWPLPWPLNIVNRATQRMFSLAARGVRQRAEELDAALNR